MTILTLLFLSLNQPEDMRFELGGVAGIRIRAVNPVAESVIAIDPREFERRTAAQRPVVVTDSGAIAECIRVLNATRFRRRVAPVDVRYSFEFLDAGGRVQRHLFVSRWGDVSADSLTWETEQKTWVGNCWTFLNQPMRLHPSGAPKPSTQSVQMQERNDSFARRNPLILIAVGFSVLLVWLLVRNRRI